MKNKDDRRILAEHNACQGITTEALEAGYVKHCSDAVISLWEANSGNPLATHKEKLTYKGRRIFEVSNGE